MKKVVLNLNVYDNKAKQKAMKAASSVSGINSIAIDMNENKMTVIGDMDPVDVVGVLRKSWLTEIDFVGPPDEPKAPEKKEEEKKDDPAAKIVELIKAIELGGGYNNPYRTSHYYLETLGENPNACCVIS